MATYTAGPASLTTTSGSKVIVVASKSGNDVESVWSYTMTASEC